MSRSILKPPQNPGIEALAIRQPALSIMRDYYNGDDGHLVEVDWQSPDRVAAGKEALHEDDVDFDADLAPYDKGETIDVTGIREIPRDALQRLVLFLIPTNSHPAKRWRIAQLRLAIVAQMVDADGIGTQSFEDLAQELKCTRAILSYHSLKMIDAIGIDKLRNGKPRRTREIYRESAIAVHKRLGHKMTQDAPHTGSATQ
jgi:hypothetical protein